MTTPLQESLDDQALIDAWHALSARGGRVTDRRLAEQVGRTEKATQHRRLKLIRGGRWPGRPKRQPIPREITRFIEHRGLSDQPPLITEIALEIRVRFGRSIDCKTIWNVLNRPWSDELKTAAETIRQEALSEFRGRHQGHPLGVSATEVLHRAFATEGRLPIFKRGVARA